jgi:Domain of unknown function (DUF6089)
LFYGNQRAGSNKKLLLALKEGMSKNYFISAILFMLLLDLRAEAQYFFRPMEYGVSAGASQYFGDLNDHYGFQTIHPAFGGFARLHLNQFIAIKAVTDYTHVSYSDQYNSNEYEKQRNLKFQSDIVEFAIQSEFSFFRFATGDPDHRFTPYLTGGLGIFYYNPYTYYNGTLYYLRNLGTEGQLYRKSGKAYSDVSVCFPIGAGVKYWIRPGMNISFEIADRLTTTDYLDDVSTVYAGAGKFPNSAENPAYWLQNTTGTAKTTLGEAGKQRGNTASKDQYLMAIVSLSFQFKTYKCPAYLMKGFTPEVQLKH